MRGETGRSRAQGASPEESGSPGNSLSSPRQAVRAAAPTWPVALKEAIRDPRTLCDLLGLSPEAVDLDVDASEFPLFVPREFLARIRPGDAADPLLRQVLPTRAEGADRAGFGFDPTGDQTAARDAGLLQKYVGRVLLILTGACPVHCRYCFRRHYPYATAPKGLEAWASAISQIAADPSVEEVIYSGGDPLMLADATLGALTERLAAIKHVRRLRIHSRLPIMIPQRVDDTLLAWLTGTRLVPLLVVHANHPREIDEPTAAALRRLVQSGVPTLNQAVLLAGVNDDAATLTELCTRLINLGVQPYYLHQLDRVAGAAHFEVPIARGRALVAELRRRLPGYAVPRYVQEEPGAESKTPLEG